VNTFEIVKEAVDEWNPYTLLEEGVPDDEFDSESKGIAAKIDAESNTNDIAYIISRVFTISFGESFSYESCIDVANKIKNAMSELKSQWQENNKKKVQEWINPSSR
jgi:hypothetical protein